MPHLAEEMYQNLVRNVDPDALVSVHMCDWPVADDTLVDKELESHMKTIQSMVESASNARQKVGRKLRWPVSRIVITPKNEQSASAVNELRSVLMDQTNSKDIVLTGVGETWDELGVEAVPTPSGIGPVFKGDAGKVIGAIKQADTTLMKTTLAETGEFKVTLADKTSATVTGNMVDFKETLPENVANAESSGGMVYVDARLNQEIESEGFSREVIRRVQDMRKELNLAVDENIKAIIRIDDERVLDLVLDMEQFIAKEVRAKVLVIGLDVDATGTLFKDWDVEGVPMHIGITAV
jgi:isoleucyl-tRNA synthetase